MPTKIYGIRHHGAGCSKSLKASFTKNKPDVILIEGPPAANELLHHVANKKGLKPPVALLVYNPKELTEASYYPFTSFSPEYIAMEFAVEHDIPVAFIDLPPLALQQLELEENSQKNSSEAPLEELTDEKDTLEFISKDPLSYIAKLDGCEDGERWWDTMVENRDASTTIFDAIESLMLALREGLPHLEEKTCQIREAYMRKQIRTYEKKHENIAVVCGAWHVPAFINRPKIKDDNLLLKGIPRKKEVAAWIPWSYAKIASSSGYDAGVVSPAWYELLHNDTQDKIARWFVKAARLLRKEDLDASSAHVIEAVRLTHTLASVRNLTTPGLQEMYDTCICIFGNGREEPVKLIYDELIIGTRFGNVDAEISEIPLQKDFRTLSKKYKIKLDEKIWGLDLDLRKELHVAKSHFLNRLNILGIKWGNKLENQGYYKKGSFHEEWRLKWRPSYEIRLVEASLWGNTVDEATTNYVRHISIKSTDILEISDMILRCLEADLESPIPLLNQRLLDISAISTEIEKLMQLIPELVNIYQYGNVRKTDTSQVKEVIHGVIPRICIGFTNACYQLKEEAARELSEIILKFHRAINLFGAEELKEAWLYTLEQTFNATNSNPLIQGICLRLLLDEGAVNIDTAETEMALQLSPSVDTIEAATWLEGFLQGNALLIVHNKQLWNILNDWISQIKEERFTEMLPIIRRSFSQFSAADRKQIGGVAKYGISPKENKQRVIDPERARTVVPIIQTLLGIQ